MTDGSVDLGTAAQALRMEQLRGDHNMLAQRVQQGMENVAHNLADLQSSVRGVAAALVEVKDLQRAHDGNRETIAEVKNQISGIENKLEKWFDEITQTNEDRWRTYEHNRDMWRREHEADNENVKRDLESEIRRVRETMIRSVGWGVGAGTLVSVVAAGFLFWLNQQFGGLREVQQKTDKNVVINADRIRSAELYLARTSSYAPPSSQEKRE